MTGRRLPSTPGAGDIRLAHKWVKRSGMGRRPLWHFAVDPETAPFHGAIDTFATAINGFGKSALPVGAWSADCSLANFLAAF
jgi:hypothetical protein